MYLLVSMKRQGNDMDLGKLACNNGNSIEHSYNESTQMHMVVFRDKKGRYILEKDKKLDEALSRLFERVYPTMKK